MARTRRRTKDFSIVIIKQHLILSSKEVLFRVGWSPTEYKSRGARTRDVNLFKGSVKLLFDDQFTARTRYFTFWRDSWVSEHDMNLDDNGNYQRLEWLYRFNHNILDAGVGPPPASYYLCPNCNQYHRNFVRSLLDRNVPTSLII